MERVEKVVAEVVETRHMVLRDGDGVVRAALLVGGDGVPRLRLYDPAGMLRLRLAVYGTDVPAIDLADRHGQTRATLWLDADGAPALTLTDAKGRGRGELGLRAGGSPYLAITGTGERCLTTRPRRAVRAGAPRLPTRRTTRGSAPPSRTPRGRARTR